jgi:hypothetical protein
LFSQTLSCFKFITYFSFYFWYTLFVLFFLFLSICSYGVYLYPVRKK